MLNCKTESNRWLIVAICSLLFSLSMFYRVSTAVIAPDLIEELKLTSDELGFCTASFFYAFAIFQIPIGFLLDRFGARKIMTALTVLGGFGAILFSNSQSIASLITGRVFLGIGMAANMMGSLLLLTKLFKQKEFATLSGIIVSVGTVGAMLATSPLVILNQAIGWRQTFGLIGILTLFLGVFFFFIVKEDAEPSKNPIDKRIFLFKTLKKLFFNRNYWAISIGTFIRYGIYVAVQGLWAGPFLINVLHLSPLATGNILLVLNIGFIFGCPVGGYLSDRILCSRKKAILLGLSIMAISLLAIWSNISSSLIWLGFIFFFLGFGSSFGQIMYAHIKELMPLNMAATAMTGINFFTMAGGAIFLHGFGVFLSMRFFSSYPLISLYNMAFLICFVIVLVGFGIYLTTKEKGFET
jgi:MFS family permease